MFSALKKLVGSEQAPGRDKNIPAGLQSMNQALQRRFAKGVQYNMKIVIRGDRNTGKTTLWHRLQGKKFVEEYIPTQEIQPLTISSKLKSGTWSTKVESEMALDAEFLDVYKSCNGVVMMFDITKQWTFNYIMRELPKVPTHVPVCVLGNCRDMGEHRVVLPDDVRHFIDSLHRPPGSSYFRYAESSMKNGFGLKYLHKFLNVPFLQLQRETLLRQLETNQLDIDATLEELLVQQETEDQNYDIFLEVMEARSRGHATPMATNGQSPSSGSQSPVVPPSTMSTGSSSPSTPQLALQPPLHVPSACPSPLSPTEAPAPPPRRSIISRLFGTSPAAEVAPVPPEPAPAAGAPGKVQNVEDFVPEDSLDHSFLDDPASTKDEKKVAARVQQDSDSDGEALGGNPMVAGVQEDVDLEDKPPSRFLLPTGLVPRETTLSSVEEADEVTGHPRATVLAPQKCAEPETKLSSTKASRPHRGIGPRAEGSPHGHEDRKDKQAASSESDPEGPIATQMLSFVMDDPDFESDSDTQRRVDEFPVREDLSDDTDEDASPARPPPLAKPPIPSFRVKGEDLFGLGLEETGRQESYNAGLEGKPASKEKKKKKGREEEVKAAKKRSKHKRSRARDEGRGRDEQHRRRPRAGRTAADGLEAFLGGGAPGGHLGGGGGYEEL
ncbi:rab-like protein 6 isoform X5 [Manis pentadactyla]|uniref:rab-like protein 6 isoform X5 n=1 Tax=Manis pentadactyla TaxID=143292 RepID=UPI00255CDBE3|nr:rab-like protein 6 isoform X5 [Manis pentadactyla]